MAILFAIIVIIVLIIAFGFSKKNAVAGAGGFLGAVFLGAMGIAVLGTAIAFPPFAISIVIFFIIKGILSK